MHDSTIDQTHPIAAPLTAAGWDEATYHMALAAQLLAWEALDGTELSAETTAERIEAFRGRDLYITAQWAEHGPRISGADRRRLLVDAAEAGMVAGGEYARLVCAALRAYLQSGDADALRAAYETEPSTGDLSMKPGMGDADFAIGMVATHFLEDRHGGFEVLTDAQRDAIAAGDLYREIAGRRTDVAAQRVRAAVGDALATITMASLQADNERIAVGFLVKHARRAFEPAPFGRWRDGTPREIEDHYWSVVGCALGFGVAGADVLSAVERCVNAWPETGLAAEDVDGTPALASAMVRLTKLRATLASGGTLCEDDCSDVLHDLGALDSKRLDRAFTKMLLAHLPAAFVAKVQKHAPKLLRGVKAQKTNGCERPALHAAGRE